MIPPDGSIRTFKFSSYESAYVNLVPSELVGRMFDEVTEVWLSRGQTMTLDPDLYSYDPDDRSLAKYNFKWWCRKESESFKTDVEGNWREDFPPYLESFEYAGAAGGCDGNGPGTDSILFDIFRKNANGSEF